MSSSTDDPRLSPGERILERDLRVEITDPTDPLHHLFVLIETFDSRTLAAATGYDAVLSQLTQASPPAEIGMVAHWRDLKSHGLLDLRDDPVVLGTGVRDQQLPVTLQPLSRLRSVEATLTAAEETGMAYNEALKPLLDPQSPPPKLQELTDWLTTFGYHVRYDPATETLRVSRSGQTCAVFADGSVVGEEILRDEIQNHLGQLEDRQSSLS